jgi:large subunit ribosomal protein L24
MRKIKKGDHIIVLAGKCKGMQGTVMHVDHEVDKVVVEGINMVKKHVKPNPQKGVEGGIVEKEAPIHVSNVAVYNPTTKKADRVGVKTLENGKRVRIYKSNNEVIDV